ncbi:variable surface lipoprotein [Mycoplasmopsis agalactiae]|uniref:variable surface lipoprotein n=1 Tax=Mycoplasmopsis agalactiae TaxID=2110 RepID=UPI001F16A173|nr:variable surface lipoprotein [Mycoplasmopsis agalactiae]MCE6061528.1 variable surface lipoprotein [Mycoplasmopsis agalactiae]
MKKVKLILGALLPITTIPFIAASCNDIEIAKSEASKQDKNNNKIDKKVEKTESHNLKSSTNNGLEDKKENETIEKDKQIIIPEKIETPEIPKIKQDKSREEKSKEETKKEEKKNKEETDDDFSPFNFNMSSNADQNPENESESLNEDTLTSYKSKISSEISELNKEVTNYNGFINNEIKSQFEELKEKLNKLLTSASTSDDIEKILTQLDFFSEQFEGYNIKIESMKDNKEVNQ